METIAEVAEQTAEQFREIRTSTPASGSQECLQCCGTGWTLDENRRARQCGCSIEPRIQRRLPERYWLARLEDFPEAIIRRVLAWLLDARDGLRITGPPGTGKTYLAAALVRHRITQNRPAEFLPCSRLYRDLRQCFADGSSERAYMERLFDAPFLALDDLCAGGLSDFERRTTLEILDERLSACRLIVVTSNWTLSEIAMRMDDRIASRLSTFTHIELAGVDRRVRKGRAEVALERTRS